jgi:hypothetical protein
MIDNLRGNGAIPTFLEEWRGWCHHLMLSFAQFSASGFALDLVMPSIDQIFSSAAPIDSLMAN